MSRDIVQLRGFRQGYEARLAQSKLEAMGIEAWVDGEDLNAMNLWYSMAAGGVRLFVERSNSAKASEILDRDDSCTVDQDPQVSDMYPPDYVCVHCGSAEVQPRKLFNPLRLLLVAVGFIFGFPLSGSTRVLHCSACGGESQLTHA